MTTVNQQNIDSFFRKSKSRKRGISDYQTVAKRIKDDVIDGPNDGISYWKNGLSTERNNEIEDYTERKESNARKVILNTDFGIFNEIPLISDKNNEIKKKPTRSSTRNAKLATAHKTKSRKIQQSLTANLLPSNTLSETETKQAISKLNQALKCNQSPLKSSSSLNVGIKALEAAKKECNASLSAATIASPLRSPPLSPLLTFSPRSSNLSQASKVRRKLLEEMNSIMSPYKTPPLPKKDNVVLEPPVQIAKNLNCESLADLLAKPTPVELKRKRLQPTQGKSITCLPTETKIPEINQCPTTPTKLLSKPSLPSSVFKTPEKLPRMTSFTTLEFQSPTKFITPTKTAPLYEKFHALAATPPKKEQPLLLPLPFAYSALLELFRCLDTIVTLFLRRNETCNFTKLQKGVQSMSNRSFLLSHLAQIKSIYPESFLFRQEKILQYCKSPSKNKIYEIVIIPISDQKYFPSTITSPRRSPRIKSPIKPTIFTTSQLLQRKIIFNTRLVNEVHVYHEKFLLSLPKPLIISKEAIKRWHVQFDLETVLPIPLAELPLPPISTKLHTASDILASTQQLLPARMKQALLTHAEKEIAKSDTNSKENTNMVSKSVFKGVSSSLLERIQFKEQLRAKRDMLRDEKTTRKIEMFERLPEICSILRNLFLSEKRGVLLFETVIDKLQESFRSSLANDIIRENLELLCDTIPNWAKIVTVKNAKYLKIVKSIPLNTILDTLRDEKFRIENSYKS